MTRVHHMNNDARSASTDTAHKHTRSAAPRVAARLRTARALPRRRSGRADDQEARARAGGAP
jgi:hypothetical protein